VPLLQVGQKIRGTYEVERFLGEGAFAEVYRVKHRFLGRQAIKVFKLVGMTLEETEEMLSEAILLSRLEHPNVIRVFDANVTETSKGTCGFFTMEHVGGGSLERYWQSHGDRFIPIETTVEIIRQVCRGLSVAHIEKPPIIHRDIKPQNILIGYDAMGIRVRVSDFGLAKRVNPLTLLATAMGTRCFKAPEVFRNHKADSCAGDVWAIGNTFYLLLTDRLPFSEIDELDVFDPSCFEKSVTPPSQLNTLADAGLDKIAMRALSLKPQNRYANAIELLRALDQWKPITKSSSKPSLSSGSKANKSALGLHSPVNEKTAKKMVREALNLAKRPDQIMIAADLMEEAFIKWPGFRENYEYLVKLWRRGIIY